MMCATRETRGVPYSKSWYIKASDSSQVCPSPTAENIQNGSYPHVAAAYVVTVRTRTDNMRKTVDLLLSPQGQELVEKTGYVPVGNPSLPVSGRRGR